MKPHRKFGLNMRDIKLSIIIVSWNVKGDLMGCLSSLKENPPCEPFEQILIDNMSTDGTVDTVKD